MEKWCKIKQNKLEGRKAKQTGGVKVMISCLDMDMDETPRHRKRTDSVVGPASFEKIYNKHVLIGLWSRRWPILRNIASVIQHIKHNWK